MPGRHKTVTPFGAIVTMAVILTLVLVVAFVLKTPHSSASSPKLIRADGVEYVACEGALWLPSDGDSKNPDTMSYSVIFRDAEGRTRELKRVHMLKVMDLPKDTPRCARTR
jgi:hypothetical protein